MACCVEQVKRRIGCLKPMHPLGPRAGGGPRRCAKARARKLEAHLLAHRLLVLPISSTALPVPVSRLSNEPIWSVWSLPRVGLKLLREKGVLETARKDPICAPHHAQRLVVHHTIAACRLPRDGRAVIRPRLQQIPTLPSRIFNVQTGCCKPNCFGPSRRRASNHRSGNPPSRPIPRLARRQPASSCLILSAPASQADTDTDLFDATPEPMPTTASQHHNHTLRTLAQMQHLGCGSCHDSASVPFSRITSVAAAVASPARNDSPTCTGIRGR